MTKFSVDFDDTLSNTKVQQFVSECVKLGHDVHIVTSRMNDTPLWNTDLYRVADFCGIPHDNIHFCNTTPKYKFFQENKEFSFHLDDEKDEVDNINLHCKPHTIGIRYIDILSESVFSVMTTMLLYGHPINLDTMESDP